MKYKLLSVSKFSLRRNSNIGVNIGDYIQALASSQFYPQIDGFIDRDEELREYNGDTTKLIANGWYMHNPKQWPPSPKIKPLFVAFHINSVAKKELLSPESINYLKQYTPIGCRDTKTLDLLQNAGIESYFSGCMTLTLGYKYHSAERENVSYIVDPIYDGRLSLSSIAKAMTTILSHPFHIWDLIVKKRLDLQHGRNVIKNVLKIALYYKEYTKIFTPDVIINSEYISQDTNFYKNAFPDDKQRLLEAERLIKLYSRAKLVITSRIHCALPCLGLETPVVYMKKHNDTESSICRLGGLIDFFNCIEIEHGKLKPKFVTKFPISTSNLPINKTNWKPYAESLISKCKHFINE